MDDIASDPGDVPTEDLPLLSRSGRAAVAFTGFLACCVVLTTALTGWADHRAGRTAVPPATRTGSTALAAPDPSGSLARIAAVQPLLDRRAAAVRTGRGADWDLTLDAEPSARAFRAGQLTQFDRIRRLPLRVWRYELLETGPVTGPASGRTFVARVRLAYRLSGDTRDVERTHSLTMVRRGHGWVIGGTTTEGEQMDPWEMGPLAIHPGRRSVVIGIGSDEGPGAGSPRPVGPLDPAELERTAREADAAAARVDDVWGVSWPRVTVVVIPSDARQLAMLLGRRDSSGLDQVAAVTNGALARDPAPAGGAADRVVVNPGPFGRLSPLGRRVVLTHELTHVATRASARLAVPLWVEEGFANYVAYRGSGLSGSLVAADVLPLIRAGTAGEHLPSAADFDPANGPIGPAYADAWLAFDLMARDDPRSPVDFFRVAAGLGTGEGDPRVRDGAGHALAAAFRGVLDTEQDAFENRWRAHRAALVEERSW